MQKSTRQNNAMGANALGSIVSGFPGSTLFRKGPQSMPNPQAVARQNADAFIRQLKDPFGTSGMRLPSASDFGTATFQTLQRVQPVNVTTTSSSSNTICAGVVARPYAAGGTLTLTGVAADVETWSVGDDPSLSNILTLYERVRCVGMGVRAWNAASLGLTTPPGNIIAWQYQDTKSDDTSTNMKLILQSQLTPGAVLESSLATQVCPLEVAWEPISFDSGAGAVVYTGLGTTASTDIVNAFTWQLPLTQATATTLIGADNAILIGATASASQAIQLTIEIVRHYEGIPLRSLCNLTTTRSCFGSVSELDYANMRSAGIPLVRPAGTVSSRPVDQITSEAADGTSANVSLSSTLHRLSAFAFPEEAKLKKALGLFLSDFESSPSDKKIVYCDGTWAISRTGVRYLCAPTCRQCCCPPVPPDFGWDDGRDFDTERCL